MNVSRGKVGAAVLTISASIVGYQASASSAQGCRLNVARPR